MLGIVWVSAACSTARNGPTSLPVGETTPIAPARMSSGSQLVNANTMPRDDHQRGAGDEDATPAEPVGLGRQPERDERVADQGERQDEPDRQRIQPGRGEIQHQDDGEEAVAEHPQRPHREQEPAVAVEAPEARDQAWIGCRGRSGHAAESRRRSGWQNGPGGTTTRR